MDCLDDQPCVSGCPRNIPATADSFFSYEQEECFSRIGDIYTGKIILDSVPNSISTLFWIEKKNYANTYPVANFGIGKSFLSEDSLISTCKPKYSWLVNAEGEGDSTVEVTPTPLETTCDYQNLSVMTKGFDAVLSVLNQNNREKSRDQTNAILDLAQVFPVSLPWISCRELALSFLEPVEQTTVVSSTACQEEEGTIEYLEDACCNTEIADTKCCVARDLTVVSTTLMIPKILNFTGAGPDSETVDPEIQEQILTSVFGECLFPGCVSSPLKSLVNYGDDKSCYQKTVNTLVDPRFSANPFDKCTAIVYGVTCFYDSLCNPIGPLSRCMFPALQCSVPCETDDDCLLGTCQPTRGFGNTCAGGSTDTDDLFNAWSDCLFNSIDPFLAALVRDEINQNPSIPFREQFETRITKASCVDSETGTLSWPGTFTTKEECEAAWSWCPWYMSPVDPTLPDDGIVSDAFCNNDFPAANVCGLDFSPYMKVVGNRPSVCEVRMEDHGWYSSFLADYPVPTGTFCTDPFVGGVYVSAVPNRFQFYGPCLHPTFNTSEECYGEYCIPGYRDLPCSSYCYVPGANETSCVGELGNRILEWHASANKCLLEWIENTDVMTGGNLYACLGVGGMWQQGYTFQQGFYDTPETCKSVCWNNVELLFQYDESNCEWLTCTSCIDGDEPQCTDEDLCYETEACTNVPGCLFPHANYNALPSKPPCLWNPEGCVTTSPESFCKELEPYGYYFLPQFRTKESCEGYAGICRDPAYPDATVEGAGSLPEGFNLYNQEECEKCGMIWEPFYKWQKGKLRQKRSLVPLKFMPKESTRPQWIEKLDSGLFADLLESARASRLDAIYSSQLYCEFGVEKELLSSLACNCGEGGDVECLDTLTSPVGSIIGFVTACQNVPTTIEESGLLFEVAENFQVSTGDLCAKIKVTAIPLEQFEQEVSKSYSSLAIISETRRAKNLGMFVYNQNDIVVGQLLAAGNGFQFDPVGSDFEGLEICIPIPESFATWQLEFERHTLDVAWSDLEFSAFHPLKVEIPDGAETVCLAINNSDGRAYFLVGLVEDWENVEMQTTWTSPELGLIITCNVGYVILVFLTTFVVVGRVLNHFRKNRKDFVDFPKLALVSIFVLSVLRSVYFFGMPFGTFDDEVGLQVVFSDLPALLFMIAVVATGCMWAHLDIVTQKNTSKDKQLAIYSKLRIFFASFCVSLCLIFVVLQSVFGGLYNNQEISEFTCATTLDEKTKISSSEIVSILYKAFFAFYCFVIAVAFCFYGVRSLMAVHGTQVGSKQSILRKFSVVTIFCTIGLLIQAAVLLATTRLNLPNTTKLALILASETVPSFCLVVLFMPDEVKETYNLSTVTSKGRSQRSSSKGVSRGNNESNITS
eukprot:TRINITY_DN1092_c0_g1_i1.p1 TRINITY_DN1092_c0_g1~~TRINITY_DN1092_c0_g1_i1.p1  ORF type:complete len:1581 (-),score=334.19 TRINITY_DN1092_c0_g1_i1:160-4293(-)